MNTEKKVNGRERVYLLNIIAEQNAAHEAELAEKEIAIKERKLDADIKKQADALKYQAERQAEAELIKRQRDADAKAYEASKSQYATQLLVSTMMEDAEVKDNRARFF